MSREEWRDARLKKALDSAPDADARPAPAVREAILHKARLTAVAAQPTARRMPRPWRWLGSLAAVGALVVVLIGGRQLFLASQPAREEAAPQVAMAPAPEPSAKVAEAPASPPIVVAEASPPPSRKAAVPAKKPAVVAAAPSPPTVVAEAPPPPPPPAAPMAAPAPADTAWTVLSIATADGPLLLRRDQLSDEAAGKLSRLLAAAEGQQQLRTQLADERQASRAQAFARSPAPPGLLRIELLLGERPVGSLALPPGDPLRLEIEAAAAAKPASAPSP